MATHILIVDDEPVIRTLLSHAFQENTNWVIECVESAEIALKTFKPGEFDLVIVDKNLPGITGTALVRMLRTQDPHVGIGMITGFGSKNNAVEMLHLGIDCYIEKPFTDITDIGRQFELVIEKSQHRRKLKSQQQQEEVKSTTGTYKLAPTVNEHALQHTVLVVTGKKSNQDWFAQHVTGTAAIMCADTSKEALRLIEENPTDLVIVDTRVSNPGVDAFIEYIHDNVMGIEVAVMSSPLSMEEIKHFIELGVATILDLPLNEAQCKERLSKWCH